MGVRRRGERDARRRDARPGVPSAASSRSTRRADSGVCPTGRVAASATSTACATCTASPGSGRSTSTTSWSPTIRASRAAGRTRAITGCSAPAPRSARRDPSELPGLHALRGARRPHRALDGRGRRLPLRRGPALSDMTISALASLLALVPLVAPARRLRARHARPRAEQRRCATTRRALVDLRPRLAAGATSTAARASSPRSRGPRRRWWR